ncbi:hypothetical protein SAMN05444141_103586 [Pseudovibrio denitrificans]|uniref:Uncharacterized protein n=1 Tax=Pseudovibrio denitrificans TaxID=258256 RepID=A0A1I7B2Z2_9HYPH|nr:hypothetical protein SAMN05444141_103586 [Pseudovibrio denitrificans]
MTSTYVLFYKFQGSEICNPYETVNAIECGLRKISDSLAPFNTLEHKLDHANALFTLNVIGFLAV